jgi:MFS transporter, PHS family, inorganic phosphate transporter
MPDVITRAARPDEAVDISPQLLKEMDEAGTGREHWQILLTSGMGFFTDAYDLFIIGVALKLMKDEWAISTFQKATVASLALLTSAAGALVFGKVADRLGRRKIYGYEVLILAVGAIASAFSPNIWWLIALRGILGFGIGGDYPVSATIMSEYAAKRHRGRMVSLVFAMQGAGLVIGPLIAILLLSTGMSHDLAWRLMLGLGAIPALSVFYLRRQIRETPRFLLAQIEAREQQQLATDRGLATGLRGILADRRTLTWLVGVSLAWFLFDIVYYGNTISSPIIVDVAAPHASVMQQIAITLGIFAVFALPGYALAAATVDRIGRKALQVGGFIAMAVAFALLWLIPGATTTLATFIVLFGATYFFAQFGPNTTTFVYPAEIFPVHVRTTSHGIAAAAGKIGAFIGAASMATLLSAIGLGRTSLIVAAVALAGALVTLVTLPEPRGKSLEDFGSDGMPSSAVTLGLAESRGTRPPPSTSRRRGR